MPKVNAHAQLVCKVSQGRHAIRGERVACQSHTQQLVECAGLSGYGVVALGLPCERTLKLVGLRIAPS